MRMYSFEPGGIPWQYGSSAEQILHAFKARGVSAEFVKLNTHFKIKQRPSSRDSEHGKEFEQELHEWFIDTFGEPSSWTKAMLPELPDGLQWFGGRYSAMQVRCGQNMCEG